MKTNHEAVMRFIHQAIVACKDDAVFENVKTHLVKAMQLVENVSKKRNSRETQVKTAAAMYADQAKKNNERWMEMLKNGLEIKNDEE